MRVRNMRVLGGFAGVLLFQMAGAAPADNSTLLDSMDALSFSLPREKGHIELVPGKIGNAEKFSFDKDCMNVMMAGHVAGMPEWDKAAGFSFWVKGDGSEHLGGLEFVWNNDYSTRYACAFPISSTEWKKIVVPWRDLIPEMGKTTQVIDAKNGNVPSKLGPLIFGKWWYWRDYAAHSYAIDDIRLEPVIEADKREFRPAAAPLARVLAKIKAGKPITIVTMGDSLTDVNHWSNHETNWPKLLQAQIKQKYNSTVTIVNPAMGGTELRQNLVVLPRWSNQTPEPDLVTVFFGGNDWNAGMRGESFAVAQQDAIDRIRRATNGKADVLIMTTCPALENGDTVNELAVACRQAAKLKKAGICDIYSAFQAAPQAEKTRLFAQDKVHLGLPGQELTAQSVLNALEKGGQ